MQCLKKSYNIAHSMHRAKNLIKYLLWSLSCLQVKSKDLRVVWNSHCHCSEWLTITLNRLHVIYLHQKLHPSFKSDKDKSVSQECIPSKASLIFFTQGILGCNCRTSFTMAEDCDGQHNPQIALRRVRCHA